MCYPCLDHYDHSDPLIPLSRYPTTIPQIETLNDKFAEARDEIEMAKEDHETVYFQESYDTAAKVTDETLALWENILSKLQVSRGNAAAAARTTTTC